MYWTTFTSPDPLPNPPPYPGTSYQPTTCFDTDFNLMQNEWYHFAVTVGPEGNTGYLNGMELVDRNYYFNGPESTEFFADIPNLQELWIGRGFLGFFEEPDYFPGAIDELSIYDRPLTAEEVSALYLPQSPCLGDFDNDGRVNATDIDLLRAAIRMGSMDQMYDLNSDGMVDSDDFAFMLTDVIETPLGMGTGPADFNLDGLVGILDLGALGDGYGKPGGWADGDANGDGVVGILDLAQLGEHYGYDRSVIPEPVTMSLLALGGLAILKRRRA